MTEATPARATLIIRLKRKADGSASLTCERPDGSVTWERQDGERGGFLPVHDLTHFAVETVLNYRHGFFGLLAQGWNLEDFGQPWPRGRLPAEAVLSEFTVGFFDQERAGGVEWSAEDFNTAAATYFAGKGERPPPLTDEDLTRIRAARLELFARWRAVPPGDTLELHFPPQPAG